MVVNNLSESSDAVEWGLGMRLPHYLTIYWLSESFCKQNRIILSDQELS